MGHDSKEGSRYDSSTEGPYMYSQKLYAISVLLTLIEVPAYFSDRATPYSFGRGFARVIFRSFPSPSSSWYNCMTKRKALNQILSKQLFGNSTGTDWLGQSPPSSSRYRRRPPFYMHPDAGAKPGMYDHAHHHVLNKRQRKH